MKSTLKKYGVIGLLGIFMVASLGSLTSCKSKKNCHPPCPTWNKKKKH